MFIQKAKFADEKRNDSQYLTSEEVSQDKRMLPRPPEWFDKADKFADSWDFEDCEELIGKGISAFYLVGKALMRIRDNKWYKKTGYSSFENYCVERWGFKRHYANRLIGASNVIDNLVPIGTTLPETESEEDDLDYLSIVGKKVDLNKSVTNYNTLPETESQARVLASLKPDEQREVYKRVVETAPNSKPTASHIKQTRDEYLSEKMKTDEEEIEHDEDAEMYKSTYQSEEDEEVVVDDRFHQGGEKTKPSLPPKTKVQKSKSRSIGILSKPKVVSYSTSQIRQAIDAVFSEGFNLFSNNVDDFKEKFFTELLNTV